jgi:hypothetical protein
VAQLGARLNGIQEVTSSNLVRSTFQHLQVFIFIMTAVEFRKLALDLPEAVESSHMNHPDFRVRGKIFATLWPDDDWGMVKLTPEQQTMFTHSEPKIFEPIQGGWGRRGATRVLLRVAKKSSVKKALVAAWLNTAPKKLSNQFPDL